MRTQILWLQHSTTCCWANLFDGILHTKQQFEVVARNTNGLSLTGQRIAHNASQLVAKQSERHVLVDGLAGQHQSAESNEREICRVVIVRLVEKLFDADEKQVDS